MRHQYKITIDYNEEQGLHPLTVSLERHGETKEASGKNLKSLLGQVTEWIIKEETE